MADKYDSVLSKKEDGKPLSKNETETWKTLLKEHGTDRGNAARAIRDGK